MYCEFYTSIIRLFHYIWWQRWDLFRQSDCYVGLALPTVFWLKIELVEELQGYMVERLKELCSAKGIKVARKAKDELITLLVEKMAKESTRTGISDSLMKMVLQVQEQQLQMQKEDSTTIRETGEANASNDGQELIVCIRGRWCKEIKAKPPKPTLQKLTPSDDMEALLICSSV